MCSFCKAGSFTASQIPPVKFYSDRFQLLFLLLCASFFYPLSVSVSQDSPAQAPASNPAASSATQKATAELASRDEPATFKVNVKLVVVRVVVRDAKGHAVGNLHQEDFQLFDKGKPQVISQFELEQPGSLMAKARHNSENSSPIASEKTSAETEVSTGAETTTTAAVPPERFVAYLFDDVHLEFGDLAQARDAATREFSKLRPTDRAAIFTTSGHPILDFTDDQLKLRETLLRLRPQHIGPSTHEDCPDISYYQADRIMIKNDPEALSIALQEASDCQAVPGGAAPASPVTRDPSPLVSAISAKVIAAGEHESRLALGVLKDVVRQISRMPGQRSVILVSPGFITPQMEYEFSDVIDRAIRAQVVINSLDARGLYAQLPFGDISRPGSRPPPAGKSLLEAAAAQADDDVLEILAAGTGGIFFHNNNDLAEGFQRVGETPEYSYVLAFAPQNLKLDGKFHDLKVTLKGPQKLNVQARRGYYAPKKLADPNEQVKQEIEDAIFSQEEIHNLPVKLQTQYFKASDADAKLIVLAHVDVRRLRFRKLDGRNNNVLTCVSALFNRDGTIVQGMEKTITMNLKDETLEHKLTSGITLKTSFDVKPGSYMVRLVVRDAEAQLMSAENGSVQIR